MVKLYDDEIEMNIEEPFICDDCLSAKFCQCKSCGTYFCEAEFIQLLKRCGKPFVDRCIFCSTEDFIRSSANLNELRDTLNLIREYDVDVDQIDYCSLPTFSVSIQSPEEKSEIFSWDDESYLYQPSEWEIGERCRMCGEADFHCSCTESD